MGVGLQDFAELVPIIPIADARALGAGLWDEEALEALATHGAVLLRGPVLREDGVELALSIIDEELLDDAFWSTPRKRVGGKTLTATEYPSPRTIQLHSEMAYMNSFPRFLAFHALEVADEGGQTTICNIEKVTEALGDRLRPFAEKGVTYRRTFQKGIDIAWQTAFQTEDKADVEKIAERNGMELEWLSGDALVTRHKAQGVITSEDGRPIIFNQAHIFHASNLDPQAREGIEKLYGAERLPRHALYGDGSEIPLEDIQAVQQAFENHQTGMHWRPGDILIIDNMRYAHGRMPFKGTRRLTVSMAREEKLPVRTALS
ncbi:TauD/TfdA family dioxygenase [Sphingomonas sp.]|uniref:TauD/TfdA family dioxygenase n=1 Tax=Sphingomonas sp. TaxID=28214 RepID=UPI001B2C50DB|nr:TauD/TfdA family dioxygenase [Sphingomonas sp.]MBO9712329.1 TauD/TfdA family dioxygenase [Sphingomonas sp.]